MWPNRQFPADLVIFAEEFLLEKLFFCAVTQISHIVLMSLFADVLQNRCGLNFRNIRRETPVLKSLFNKL